MEPFIIFLLKCINPLSCITKLCLTLCDRMDCSTPGFPVFHYLPEFEQTHVHWVSDDILPSRPPSPPSPLALNLSQHQSLFQWVGSSHQVAKVLKLQLQHVGQFFKNKEWFYRNSLEINSSTRQPFLLSPSLTVSKFFFFFSPIFIGV